ncbi:hypothetical protein GXW84_33800 [Rhodococcus sp. IEGM 248]|nr:hypothetical protein [Rhodococcus sp. IEGM 248]
MPIQIRELHIRVAVTAPAGGGTPAGAPPRAPGTDDATAREALVADCVERVLQILHDRKER